MGSIKVAIPATKETIAKILKQTCGAALNKSFAANGEVKAPILEKELQEPSPRALILVG
jgi:hypothetical protein